MKTILIDAWNTFVTKDGIFEEMKQMLNKFDNKKIILTNANDKEKKKYGMVDIPYEIFSLAHSPNKTDPTYYKKMLAHFSLSSENVIYFEHNQDAVKSAQSVGIQTFHYHKDKKDLVNLKKFLTKNV